MEHFSLQAVSKGNTNRIINIHQKDLIQNGMISSTTNLTIDKVNNGSTPSSTTGSSLSHVQQTPGPSTTQTGAGLSNLNQNIILINPTYFQQVTN